MIAYFADREMNIVGLASTALPKSMQILDDKRTEELKTGSVSLSFEVIYDGEQGYGSIKDIVEVGNYVMLYDGENSEYYTIIDTELNTEECSVIVYVEGVGLDLLNEIVGAYSASGAMSIADYVAVFAADVLESLLLAPGIAIGRVDAEDVHSCIHEGGNTLLIVSGIDAGAYHIALF